ncbi:hypothetical protein Scep_008691 [Stephania cephalantha]|uniref:Uncharacterized protein n=1 Tax=Stephania cephalantha TaxID=152367 RepID=A0AAP0JSN5_9MAGN
MRTFRFETRKRASKHPKRGECRNGVTNWCHHNNTPTHGQITTTLSIHQQHCPPSSTTCLLHPNSPPPSPHYTHSYIHTNDRPKQREKSEEEEGKKERRKRKNR